jgi:predicted dehydrogenase
MFPSRKSTAMEIKFLTLDPGHFHAVLVQKEMYANVSPQVHVYAPLGPDLLAHLGRIAGFNSRPENPTSWQVEVHTGPDHRRRLFAERPGNVLILAGRNAAKIEAIRDAVAAGLHVLADKPWIISAADLPRLQAVLDEADAKGLIAYDIMTERFEITSILQRELVNDPDIFGTAVAGSAAEPGVFMESVHYLKKTVAGAPLRRPEWFFDPAVQGEGLSDVGTHLVDLVPWILFPGQAIDCSSEITLSTGKRWPTNLSRADFQEITGAADFPPFLSAQLDAGRLPYHCNNRVGYTLRGIHVTLNVLWDLEAAAGGGDTHLAVFRGTRARVEVRQGKDEGFRPELYVLPETDKAAVEAALKHKVAALQVTFPGIAVEQRGSLCRITIPESYRVGHEAHFGQVTRQFLRYLSREKTLPAWEKPNMLAKYSVTTRGVEMGQ